MRLLFSGFWLSLVTCRTSLSLPVILMTLYLLVDYFTLYKLDIEDIDRRWQNWCQRCHWCLSLSSSSSEVFTSVNHVCPFYLHSHPAGAHRCRHEEHQPQCHGGRWWRRRRSRRGGQFRRRRGCDGPWWRERPRGGTRFPQSGSSGFALHEQNCRTGYVLHRHVTMTETFDWTKCSNLVGLSVGSGMREKR